MKKAITIVCIVLSALMMLDMLNAGHAFAMFLFAGIIPGTAVAIDAQTLLELYTLALGFVSARVFVAFSKAIMRRQASKGTMLSAQS